EIGSHGMRHRSWRGMDEAVIREEVFQAKERIEEVIDHQVTKVACPFGTYDRHSLAQLKKAGIKLIYTSDGGFARHGDWLQARNTVLKSYTADDVARLMAEDPWGATSLVRYAKRLVKRWR